jgi:acyl carrier protein
MQIKEKIILIMKSSLSNQNIDENSNNENTDNWDSINFLLLIVKLESEFEIKFQPEEILEINSFKSIETSIIKKIKKS